MFYTKIEYAYIGQKTKEPELRAQSGEAKNCLRFVEVKIPDDEGYLKTYRVFENETMIVRTAKHNKFSLFKRHFIWCKYGQEKEAVKILREFINNELRMKEAELKLLERITDIEFDKIETEFKS